MIPTRVSREGLQRDFEDTPGGAGLYLDLLLLVDANSASAAEIMAAALRDHGRAVIVGEQTLGKGTITAPLSDGSGLIFSIARCFTPNGKWIEGVGVIPEIIVEPTDLDFERSRDVQLFAALDFLRGIVPDAQAHAGGVETVMLTSRTEAADRSKSVPREWTER